MMRLQETQLIKRFFLILAIIAAIVYIAHELELHLPKLEIWIQQLGPFAPVGFITLFVILSPLFVSVDALCFAAGLLFSVGSGGVYVIIATYLAAAVIFFIGRRLFRHKVLTLIKKHQQLSALDAMMNGNSFKLMFLLRLTPMPFALLSYAFTVTQVRFWSYLGATSGILVYNLSLVYMGYTTKHLAGLFSESNYEHSISHLPLLLGLIVLMLILIYAAKRAGKIITQTSNYKI